MARTSIRRDGRNRPASPNGSLGRSNGGDAWPQGEYHPFVISAVPPSALLSVIAARPRFGVWDDSELLAIVVRPIVGLALVLLVHQLVRRVPWPRPFRARFVALHVVAAMAFSGGWIVIARVIEALTPIVREEDRFEGQFFLVGLIAYAIVAGILYAVESTARAARAEAVAARTQLAALRAQLHPHFLFNALHTVVQLIPVNPTLAMEAAEMVADLLRSSLEEQREEVSLDDEWRFVSRYLAVERIRFGDRLVVQEQIAPALLDARVPAFALQTLVENAVRHGAAPRREATMLEVTARADASALTLVVRNSGAATARDESGEGKTASIGTGLSRLRERLAVLYGNAARLTSAPTNDGGYEAMLVIPQARGA